MCAFEAAPHLSVAFALGAALPTTLVGRVETVDVGGGLWTLGGNARPGPEPMLAEVSRVGSATNSGPIATFLDLLPTRSDTAFDDFVAARHGDLAALLHLRAARNGDLEPEDAASLVGEAARRIRDVAGEHRSMEVHLLLRCPWNVALLLGRTLNTMRVHLYEWEDGPADDGSPTEPRYLPSLIVRSGSGGSPIERVVLPERPAN